MEASGTYTTALEEALAQKQATLETTVLPQMLDAFRLLLSTFEGPYNILLKKGLIREDPYKLEEKFSEVRVPSKDRFGPTELSEQMSVRLSQYHSQLDFVINYVEFKVSYLTLTRLKQLAALMKYIDFANLVENSPSTTTGGLAVLVERVLKGNDQVSAGIVKDGLSRASELVRRILRAIADVVLYQRETLKLELRKAESASRNTAGTRSADQYLAALRTAAQTAGLPFAAELGSEIIAEDQEQDGAALRSKVLERLAVEKKKEDKPVAKGPAPRELLLDAVRLASAAELPLRAALKTIRDTEEALSNQPLSLGERIRRFFARAAGAKESEKVYEIEYMDDSRGETRVEKIAWGQVLAETGNRLKTLHGLGQRSGPEYQRLEASTDEELFELLTRLGADLVKLGRRLEGLAALFRSRMSPVSRTTFRGVHGDLTMIRAAMAKANRQKHEYVARVEEEAQFKKLGIAPRS